MEPVDSILRLIKHNPYQTVITTLTFWLFLGINTPNPFDQMALASLNSHSSSIRTTPPAASVYLLTGIRPYLGFFYAIEVCLQRTINVTHAQCINVFFILNKSSCSELSNTIVSSTEISLVMTFREVFFQARNFQLVCFQRKTYYEPVVSALSVVAASVCENHKVLTDMWCLFLITV